MHAARDGVWRRITCTLRVMPYRRKATDSIQRARALIPCQSFGLDKKEATETVASFFGVRYGNRTHGLQGHNLAL